MQNEWIHCPASAAASEDARFIAFPRKRENSIWSRPPSLAAARQFTLSTPAFFLIEPNPLR